MKNNIILIVVLNAFTWSFGQVIEFNFKNNNSLLKYELLIDRNSNASEWMMIVNAKGDSINPDDITKSIYKNQNTSYFVDKTIKKKLLVKDSVYLKWTPQKEKRTLLGYECSSATTEFRGRTYTAFYTPNIGITAAPWKFYGLDGLVLLVYSNDGDYVFEATNINLELMQYDSDKVTKFKNNHFIDWPEFEKIYRNDVNKFIDEEKCNCENDGGNILKITRIEEIYPGLHSEGIVY